jgi:hypothetical protein
MSLSLVLGIRPWECYITGQAWLWCTRPQETSGYILKDQNYATKNIWGQIGSLIMIGKDAVVLYQITVRFWMFRYTRWLSYLLSLLSMRSEAFQALVQLPLLLNVCSSTALPVIAKSKFRNKSLKDRSYVRKILTLTHWSFTLKVEQAMGSILSNLRKVLLLDADQFGLKFTSSIAISSLSVLESLMASLIIYLAALFLTLL